MQYTYMHEYMHVHILMYAQKDMLDLQLTLFP